MTNKDERWSLSGTGAAILAVAAIIVVATLIETRPAFDRGAQAERVRAADSIAVATAGPAAGRVPLVQPGGIADAGTRGKDVSAGCGAFNGTYSADGDASVDPLVAVKDPATNIKDGDRLNGAEAHRLMGWALAARGERLLSGLCLVVDGKIDRRTHAFYGSLRPDVAAAYHKDDVAACGFVIDIAPRELPPGRHRLDIVAKTPDGALHKLPGGRSVNVF